MALIKILLVDDDEMVRETLSEVLEQNGFAVTSAANVTEALKHISSGTFEVLLSDLHMPGAGDGLTVVSAMRHANPKAVTILLSAFPEMNAAAGQADECGGTSKGNQTEAGNWISCGARSRDCGRYSSALSRKYHRRMVQTH
jgi:CheY-like chemotaxis protein